MKGGEGDSETDNENDDEYATSSSFSWSLLAFWVPNDHRVNDPCHRRMPHEADGSVVRSDFLSRRGLSTDSSAYSAISITTAIIINIIVISAVGQRGTGGGGSDRISSVDS